MANENTAYEHPFSITADAPRAVGNPVRGELVTERADKGRYRGIAFLIAAMAALGPFSIDTYLPSFPDIGRQFSVSPVIVQQTIAAYLLAFGVMTLFHGALSDSFGRRRIVLVTLVVFVLASAGCMLAWSIEALVGFRILQGLSAGGGMIVGRAMVRDLFDGIEAQRLMGRIAMMFAIAPTLAPIIGGWLQVWLGWRAVFGFLVLFSGALLLLCWRALPETLPVGRRHPFHPVVLLGGYWEALSSGRFAALVLTLTLSFSAVFLYIVSAPEFVFNLLHRSETEFFWLFGPITVGMILGAALSGRLAGRVKNGTLVLLAYGIMAGAAAGNLLFHAVHPASLPWSVLPLFFYVFGVALAMPVLSVMSLDMLPHRRGLASSCQGFVQTSGNTVISAVIAPALWGTAFYLAAGMAVAFVASGVALAVYVVLERAKRAAAAGGEK